jgi:hypothetical protein
MPCFGDTGLDSVVELVSVFVAEVGGCADNNWNITGFGVFD